MTGKNKTILLVEDEVLIALVESRMLEGRGYFVLTAHSGEEAVDTVKKNPGIDLILMDIDLGSGMDGTGAAEEILRERDVPVVFLSSHAEPGIVSKTERITSYGYVVKNTGAVVLDASIKMAFRLFEAHVHEKNLSGKLRLQSLVLDQIQDRVTVTDLKGVITYVNYAECESLGRGKDDLVGSSVHSFGEDPGRGATQSEIVETTLSRGYWRGEVVNYAADGKEVVFDSRTRLVHDEEGNSVAMCGISTDITGRTHLERSLRSSEEMYRDLVENANSIILRMDPRGEVLFINEFAQGFFGFSPEEIVGRNVVGTIVPSRDMAGKDLERMILDIGENPGKYSSNENENVRKDGSRVWVSWTNRGILDDAGEVTEVLCIGNDITEHKRMEERLRESEQRFRLLAENSTDVIWIMSFEGKFLYVSPSVTALCGFTPEEVLEISFERYVLPEYAGPVMEEIFRELSLAPENRRRSHSMELKQFCKNGSVIDIEVTASFICDETGAATGIQGSTRDITTRKAMESELKEQTDFLKVLIEAMPNPVFYKNADGCYLGCNRAFEELMGFDCGTIIGKTVFDISPLDLAERYHKADRDLFDNPGTQVYESRVESRNGERRDVIFHKATFAAPDGSVAGIIGAVLDITERKMAEEKILTLLQESDILREKAERLSREKELILKEVHHRVKNNLSVIMSLLSLQSRVVKDATAVNALEEAKNRVFSMVVLYDKLYRSENFKEVQVGEYLPRLVREIIGVFPHGGAVEVETHIEDFVLTAKKMVPLGILVNELLTNSMKYAFAGRDRGILRISASVKEGRATVAIEDDGVGLPDSINFDNTVGFGLQLVKLLTMQLHGTIKIERGEWTRFVLQFVP